MIEESVREVIRDKAGEKGVLVTVSVPAGRELARKTLNPRLGIKNGISIIGTTGIVIPYSEAAYQAAISQALDVAAAAGCPQVVITTGRRSEKFAQAELQLPEECFVQAGDYIGYTLSECSGKGITESVIWGMTGKISKLAAGHLYTNVSDSVVNIGMLAAIAVACGAPPELAGDLRRAVTANQLRRLLPPKVAPAFCERLCNMAAEECRRQTGGGLKIACIMSDYHGGILGRSHDG
jgi:cobalt-precorrin-5B (C1)-methyltransferase